MSRWLFALFCWLAIAAGPVRAHDARPVFIQLTELANHQLELLWKVPVSVPASAQPGPRLPANCTALGDPIGNSAGDAWAWRQSFRCSEELAGGDIGVRFPGINPGLSTLLRVELGTGEIFSQILKPGEDSWRIPERESSLSVARQYIALGTGHIFAGYDHLLFVACLVFIAGTLRRTVIAISGFTLAHSVTLSLSALDLVRLPVPPVEAAIALSIVFLAHEIARYRTDSWTWRYPLLVSSLFGLLHGFGFASVLREIGLPQTEMLTGLLAFNIGVEIGQLAFLVLLVMSFMLIRRVTRLQYSQILASAKAMTAAGYAVGIVASYWLVERLSGFFA